jgi:hypothetical protein
MTRQKGGITLLKNKATEERLRDEMIFWEAMAEIDREAKLSAIGSYIFDIFANDLWSL